MDRGRVASWRPLERCDLRGDEVVKDLGSSAVLGIGEFELDACPVRHQSVVCVDLGPEPAKT